MSVLFLWMGTSESRVYENMENSSETESTNDEFQPLLSNRPESRTKHKKIILSIFVVTAIIGGIIGVYIKCTGKKKVHCHTHWGESHSRHQFTFSANNYKITKKLSETVFYCNFRCRI